MTDAVVAIIVMAIAICLLIPILEWFAARVGTKVSWVFPSMAKPTIANVLQAEPLGVDPPVIIYGAGNLGRELVEHTPSKTSPSLAEKIFNLIKPIGFIDDDPAKRNTLVGGLSVLGGLADLESILASQSSDSAKVGGIIVAIAGLHDARLEQVKEICKRADIHCCLFRHHFERIV